MAWLSFFSFFNAILERQGWAIIIIMYMQACVGKRKARRKKVHCSASVHPQTILSFFVFFPLLPRNYNLLWYYTIILILETGHDYHVIDINPVHDSLVSHRSCIYKGLWETYKLIGWIQLLPFWFSSHLTFTAYLDTLYCPVCFAFLNGYIIFLPINSLSTPVSYDTVPKNNIRHQLCRIQDWYKKRFKRKRIHSQILNLGPFHLLLTRWIP